MWATLPAACLVGVDWLAWVWVSGLLFVHLPQHAYQLAPCVAVCLCHYRTQYVYGTGGAVSGMWAAHQHHSVRPSTPTTTSRDPTALCVRFGVRFPHVVQSPSGPRRNGCDVVVPAVFAGWMVQPMSCHCWSLTAGMRSPVQVSTRQVL